MCGIVGFWGAKNYNNIENLIDRMSSKLISRGPDDFGNWVKKEIGLAIGHRRLSILDISHTGSQPMVSSSKRFIISFNGEIYNHLEIRKEISDKYFYNSWKGHSDTETLLASIEFFGFEQTLSKIIGMFAFSLWDSDKNILYLARDRIGEKPLYYGRSNDTFMFSSELKSLLAHPDWNGKINKASVSLFMRYASVPGTNCIYDNFKKLSPGHYVKISEFGKKISKPKKYWNLNFKYNDTNILPFNESKEYLRLLLNDSIQKQMIADVPVGCFLSGGIDSSLVSSIMQSNSTKPIKTFTIGFNEKNFNEAVYAKRIAKHLNTDHTELYLDTNNVLDLIPQIPHIWNEPLADSSQIPTFLVSKLAKENVKVSLSGDGGDEIFCGYNRYVKGYNVWKKINYLPKNIQRILGYGINKIPSNIYKILDSLLKTNYKELLPKLSRVMNSKNEKEFYNILISHWSERDNIVLQSNNHDDFFNFLSNFSFTDFRQAMMFLDLHSYLPDIILTKVDRASMAVSLETREPFLNHRIVEFGFNLPISYKVNKGKSKYILRELLKDYVPSQYFERPKQGFSIPLAKWLRNELKDWAESLLNEEKLNNQGFLNTKLVKKHWDNCLNERNFSHFKIWNVLMFQSWLESIK